ncbi:MAG: pirin family protein [Chitinophagales bacterium]|nr:pirin family protein [Chitinophagales bacterium]MBP8754073.1 pirin family protein [Chitinophagales bacterium]MBP9189882.1 pirin family protein [Chitinophagales bacterium]MBP9703955.1 pirin family protein [Chitinophagales bacterium]
MKNNTIIKANERGFADHGWLQSFHSFSFANYYDAEKINFGALRVLNDDTVAAGMGFGTHPHDNMEIISIPLEGDLEHKDSMGNVTVIKNGDIQVMSAGTGVRHSEYNRNKNAQVKFLQIWIIPNKRNVQPRYDQITLNAADRKNKLQQIISPDANGAGVWINQDAWFNLGKFDAGKSVEYKIHKTINGLYAFILSGEFSLNENILQRRDAIGITDIETINIKALTDDAEILLIEVPMTTY